MDELNIDELIKKYKNQPLSKRLPETKICQSLSQDKERGCGATIPYIEKECFKCGKKFKKVAFWNRLSHESSVKRDAPMSHFQLALNYCNMNNWIIVKEYSLLEVQGKYIREEQEYLKYRYDVENNNFDIFLITELKRFARKVNILLEEAEFLNKCKVDLVAVNQKIDTTSPYGKFFFVLVAALAELESDEASYRVKRNVPRRAKLLRVLGNKAPFGWDWKKISDYNKEHLLNMGYGEDIFQ
ncbi:recombinase family protein [Candidatus Margulisiibacteriota bacterium]